MLTLFRIKDVPAVLFLEYMYICIDYFLFCFVLFC